MSKTIAEWQRAAHELAQKWGEHDCKACPVGFVRQWELSYREGRPEVSNEEFDGTVDLVTACQTCNGTGRALLTPTRIGARLALIHCEIAEATECVARGRMGVYFERKDGACVVTHGDDKNYWAELLERGFKPEGFPIELADVFLRLCDLAESLEASPGDDEDVLLSSLRRVKWSAEGLAAKLFELHDMLPGLADVYYSSNFDNLIDGIYDTIGCVSFFASECGVDLLAMAELKHAYNLTRPREGGRVL